MKIWSRISSKIVLVCVHSLLRLYINYNAMTYSFVLSYFLIYFFKSHSHCTGLSFSHCPLAQFSFFSVLMVLESLYLSHFFLSFLQRHFSRISFILLNLFISQFSSSYNARTSLTLLPYNAFSFSIRLLWLLCSHHSHNTMLSTPWTFFHYKTLQFLSFFLL